MDSRLKAVIEGEGESVMSKTMNDEIAEAIAMLEKANSAFERLFGKQERESECDFNKEWCEWCSVESICCIEGLCDVCKKEREGDDD